MRSTLVAVVLVLTGVPALASSIEPIKDAPKTADSIVALSCAQCAPAGSVTLKKTYRVPVLADGRQSVELREDNGKREILRTEAWMGGSPVTFVSKAPVWFGKDGTADIAGAPPAATFNGNDGIDASTQTAALPHGELPQGALPDPALQPAAAPAPIAFEPPPLDAENFQLRLN